MASSFLNSNPSNKNTHPNTPSKHQILLNFLIIMFKCCCKLNEKQVNQLKEKFSKIDSYQDFRDSYRNSILHYIISSPLTVDSKIYLIRSYFSSSSDLLHYNNDGISCIDLAVIQNEPSLLSYILSISDIIMNEEYLMRACKLLILFDHFTQNSAYSSLYNILSLYMSKYKLILKPIQVQMLTISVDADGLETAFALLLDSKRCTEVARSLGSLGFPKTFNKKDFLHSCMITISNNKIPTINESMLEHVPGYVCVKTAEIMNDAYLTGRGPLSPVRSKLSFYCDWYLTTLFHLLSDDLFHLAELPVLRSLFSFVNTLSLWYGYYPKSRTQDTVHVRRSLQDFLKRAGCLSVSVYSTNIPFKRYFTLINIFFLIKHFIHRNIDKDLDMEFIQFLVECGFSVNERDMFGSYPLHILTAHHPHQFYQDKSIEGFIRYLLKNGADPLSFDCYCHGDAFHFCNPEYRKIIESCYPKPYSLKSLTTLYLVANYHDAVSMLNLPRDIINFILNHSNHVPFLPISGFDSNRILLKYDEKFENIYICSDIS